MGFETSLAGARQAAAEGRLLIFAGAGISMLPPSFLPDWKGFNRALLEEIKTSALSSPNLTEQAAAAIRRLDIDSLAVEAFSDAIVRSFAGDDYFPLLKVLDSDRPNAHHLAIAELGRCGAVRAIVTTNFDRLLERAFGADSLEVFSAPEDFRRNPQKRCALYKVHGSVDDAGSLVDTVTQKLRGLSFPVRARLGELFREHHVLVVGFSGADLDFGSDYLALSNLKVGGHCVTWVVRPGRRLPPRAEELIREAGGTCAAADLGEVFTALGAQIQTGTGAGGEGEDTAQAEVDKRTRSYVADWMRSLGGGSFYSLLFCAGVTAEMGWAADARILRNALVHELDRFGDVLPITAIPAFNLLATAADDDGDYTASERWATRVLQMVSLFDQRRQTVAEPVKPAGLRQITEHRFSAWLQVGRSRAALGDFSGARQAFGNARQAAMDLGDRQKLSSLLANEGMMLRRQDASAEEQLVVFRRAWSFAVRSGSAQEMTEIAVNEAFTLLQIGEYDAAVAAALKAERVARWSGSLLGRLSPGLVRAEIALRRGDPEKAFSSLDSLIGEAAPDPIMQARLRRTIVASIAYFPGGRDRSLQYLSEILESMTRGEIPRDGSCVHLQSEADIQELRDIVARIEPSEASGPDRPKGEEQNERELRTILIRAEYQQDAKRVAAALGRLANGRYDGARPRRQLDLAEAALAAAERAGDRNMNFAALLLLTSACDLSGNFRGAIDAGRRILEAQPAVDEELRVRAAQNLGVVLTRIGQTGEAVPLLRSARERFARLGPAESHARSSVALAAALAAAGDRVGALAVLEEVKGVIDSTGDRVAIAKRDAMMASLKAIDDGSGPPPLFSDSAAGSESAKEEEIERLRRASESAEETCDVAALAIRSGVIRAAVQMLLEAQSSFHSNNDEHGLVRCFHLLADAAQVDRRWDDALDLTRYALTVEEGLEDVDGVVSSHAALAVQFLQVGRLDGAEWAATQSLERAAGRGASRFTAAAKYALAEAHRRAGDGVHPEASNIVHAEMEAAPDLLAGSPLRLWLEERIKQWTNTPWKSLIRSLWSKTSSG